jgi:hypothetical protein
MAKSKLVHRARRSLVAGAPTTLVQRLPAPPPAAPPTGATPLPTAHSAVSDAADYQREFFRRSVLFLDTLRVRANNMLAHEQAGLPPLLNFDYETILDARRFERPANYALLRITGCHGIGGFKRDSEVGMSLHEGHPTYFVIFYPEPCPGQTLADVLHALRRFVDEVARRHDGRPPTLYGNCQAGWAIALLAATHEGLLGPAVMNGSPLSYWAGASDVNPMRLAGGLAGGTWLPHFLGDLGDGRFDGAWLVENFESLNPANTLWEKNYKLFADVDGERERFFEFERWWTGYYFLSREEMVAIVENLFMGDRLEQGKLRICEDCVADMKAIHNPLVIFASSGDNITPPHQALNWVPAVYPTTKALKDAGQRIVYLLNSHVGHLGIFVSAAVAKLEHRAILESLDDIDRLKPGLYEMKIDNPTGDPDCRKPQYSVRFEPRNVEDIRFEYPRAEFERARQLSEWNESLYKAFVSPWVRATASPLTALIQKWLHPMRVSHYLFSDRLNPWMVPFGLMAPHLEATPRGSAPENPWMQFEQLVSQSVIMGLDQYRKVRDQASEREFTALYGG